MYKCKTVGVVVPCYNVERYVGQVVETMPDFVDRIYLVEDCSRDGTPQAIEASRQKHPQKVSAIYNQQNQGAGGAIFVGYKAALRDGVDVIATMDGDAQMDPSELGMLVEPIATDLADYSKGNRLVYGEAWNMIPRIRYLGNSMLSLLTKIASGYWHVADTQTSYCIINRETLAKLNLDAIYKRYGYPNDFLVKLNAVNARVKEMPIKPIYHEDGMSGIRYWKIIPIISLLLVRLFFWRLWNKYVVRDFHPLVFFYLAGIVLFPVGFVLGAYLTYLRFAYGAIAYPALFLDLFLIISGIQFLLFAMWFDMDYNRDLKV